MKVDLVVEGGGVRCIGLLGAWSQLEQQGYEISHVAGASGGAIIAALMAAGYTSQEVKQIIFELDFSRWKDARSPLGVMQGLDLVNRFGFYKGGVLESWLYGLLARKGVHTFKDLTMNGNKQDKIYYWRLRVVVSDVTHGTMAVFPDDLGKYGYEPDAFPVAKAVRASCAVPFIYWPMTLSNPKLKEIYYFVDGGMLSNFPVWIFDDERITPAWPTFGIRVNDSPGWDYHVVDGIRSYGERMFYTMMNAHDYAAVQKADEVRSVAIPTCGVQPLDFSLSNDKKMELYLAGVRAMATFLKVWNFQAYVQRYRSGEFDAKTN